MRRALLLGLVGGLGALSIVAAPSAQAQGWDHHRHHDDWRRDRGDRHDHDDHVIVVPVPVAPPAAQPVPVPVPVPVPAVQAALPPLQQLFPAAGFAQNPPQFIPLQGNNYAVSSPLLFCSVDQTGTCQLIAQQLSQITPGWGTTVMNGPEGYGMYLTYQVGA
ncbi:MAG TPA: hypothetical protein VK066_05170 [Chloroflexota bacterium]|nr:hypothetical protein [Chloroflexota bacterium]